MQRLIYKQDMDNQVLLIFNIRTGAIIGLLIGTYAPASGVIIAGINPHELNQTSYCISANHIKEML